MQIITVTSLSGKRPIVKTEGIAGDPLVFRYNSYVISSARTCPCSTLNPATTRLTTTAKAGPGAPASIAIKITRVLISPRDAP